MAPRTSRILLIDDEPLLGQTVRLAVEDQCEVVFASSGVDALSALERDSSFDLILCDLSMPAISGIAVYEAVAERYPHLLSSFVLMTGGAFTYTAREFLQQYSGLTLQKPFRLEELFRLLNRLNRRRPALGTG
ncbi:MAG TPA: response regulator [Polyangiaceae bacterium]|jgi:DNA-binding NtrC family response regulator